VAPQGAAPEGAAPGAAAGDLTARQREALALLLFSLRAMPLSPKRAGLPSTEEKWTAELVQRFGEPAFDGLLSLAARGARAGVDHEWLGALAGLARKGAIPEAWWPRLRDVAREALESPGWEGATSPLLTLADVGAPPDLLDRLWSLVTRPVDSDRRRRWRFAHAVHWAAEALARMQGAPELDARIAAEAAEALRARSFEELTRVLRIGCRRRNAAALDLAERCLAALGDSAADDGAQAASDEEAANGGAQASNDDEAAFDAAVQCAAMLAEDGRIDDAWLLSALRRPGSQRFAVAADLARGKTSVEVLGALEAALDSPARGGSAAAEAADALVAMNALGIEDGRIDGLLERAPARARASLAGTLLLVGSPLPPLRRHFLDLLVSADEKAATGAFEDLYRKGPEGTPELLEAALALGPHPAIRAGIERVLGRPTEAELYWQHGGDEEEEEDDDDEGDDNEGLE
jgi:hypothetical protein